MSLLYNTWQILRLWYNAYVVIEKKKNMKNYDPRFVEDVLFLFAKGDNIGRIAYLLDTDMDTVDEIICASLAKEISELNVC